ncbi:MAG TPA: hypothetical protein VEX39_04880 [Thermoleophilaceae bacterium]|nr:hypothetical protein [Thermoleophilaceae bacterium]
MEAMAADSRHRHAERIANGIYGTIVTAATMSVVSDKRWDEPFKTSAQVLATVVVFWLAHSFAHGIAQRATAESSVEHGDAMRDLRATWPMVAAAFPLLVPMVLVGFKVFTYNTGLWVSYGLAIVILASWGLVIGRRRRLGRGRTAGLVMASGTLGLLLITLKEIVH